MVFEQAAADCRPTLGSMSQPVFPRAAGLPKAAFQSLSTQEKSIHKHSRGQDVCLFLISDQAPAFKGQTLTKVPFGQTVSASCRQPMPLVEALIRRSLAAL